MTEQEKKDREEQEYQAKRKEKQEWRKEWEEDQQAEAEAMRKLAKKSPFKGGFIQMNMQAMPKLMKLANENGKARAILDFLIFNMDNENAVIASHKVIMEALNISKETVIRAIKILTGGEFVKTYKTGNATIYAVNANIAWKSHGKNHKYAKFKANVLIAESEQLRKTRAKRRNIIESTAPNKLKKPKPKDIID